jgi:hypothetical protein
LPDLYANLCPLVSKRSFWLVKNSKLFDPLIFDHSKTPNVYVLSDRCFCGFEWATCKFRNNYPMIWETLFARFYQRICLMVAQILSK